MIQELTDYTSARTDIIVRCLELLAAERRLEQVAAPVAPFDAETAVDDAAAVLAEAVDALGPESNYRPVGWGEPPAVSGAILIARHRVAKAALRCVSSDYAGESADADAESEYASGQLALAARNLAADVAAARRTS